MAWSELDGSTWTLPAARNKTKVDLVRPLSKAAFAVLPAKGASKFVFVSGNGRGPISGFTPLRRDFRKVSGTADWHIHDLRRTARSLMSRAGVPVDHAERCLGHVIGGVRGVCDRWEYLDEKARAYEALAAQVDRVVNPMDNVRAIGERRPRARGRVS